MVPTSFVLAVVLCALLSIIPAFILMRFAWYLSWVKARAVPKWQLQGDHSKSAEKRAQVFEGAMQEYQDYFSLYPMFVRYWIPAVLTAALCFFYLAALYYDSSTGLQLPIEVWTGAAYGFWGAYIYTLLNLGQRNFVNDLTSGVALWSVVQLALGPVLGAVLARIWTLVPGNEVHSQDRFTMVAAIGFAAGMSPKHIASTVNEIITRLWLGSGANLPPPRLLPLTQLRGISPSIADRLAEEGIEDAYGLAYANPLKLLRNTPYDWRQVVNWMDEALLMINPPDAWATLEKLGITGAIDLAWCLDQDSLNKIKVLADELKMAEELFRDIVIRVNQDAQVQLIWSLYFDDQTGLSSSEQEEPASPEQHDS